MNDRYINKWWLLTTLSDMKRRRNWDTTICDFDTVLRVLEAVENTVKDAPTTGLEKYGSMELAEKNNAIKKRCRMLKAVISADMEKCRRAEGKLHLLAARYWKGKIYAEERMLFWLEGMLPEGEQITKKGNEK